ncbi:metallophosphoesterase [Pyxidicoccus parkwayensis]|uniref:Metallophosphoesterase n=1 Tax=Pyxidicoccus parkwayensis TaxID=2813578 RepID=A0ABX7PBM6_9BACT|nr:metallophosphoesterase [Pyxidicoccus parkwaysis]QSQ27881.1 metallophosphoesterase [Pyxidicoccus parkwaysis]
MHRTSTFILAPLVAALTLATGVACAGVLPRDPFLQKVGPDTATVAFRLAADCTPDVQYGVGATDHTQKSQASGRVHAVVLTGLEPGTEYTYVVSACGQETPAKHFRTAPKPGTRSVHFTAVGDFGTGGTDQKQVSAAMLKVKPELFLALGDNAYSSGTESEIQNNLFTPMADLLAEVPLFASLGNHEYVTNQGQPYLDNLYLPSNNPANSERYYSFDWGHVHFVALDSNCAVGLASADRCALAAQKTWLEKDLAATTQPWKIVFFHHPPWSSGEHGSQLTMRRNFAPLFEKYGVDLVLTGHDHNYERSKPMEGDAVAAAGRGIPYLVVGGGGAALRPFATSRPDWSVIRDDKAHGFLDVNVVDGTLTANLIETDGSVLDSFTLRKDLPPLEQPPAGTLTVTVEGERGEAPHKAGFVATTPLAGAKVTWDFGDGGSGEGEAVQHTYEKAGQYTVTATATAGTQLQTATAVVEVTGVETPGETPPPPPPSPTTDSGTTTPDESRPTLPTNPTDGTISDSKGSGGGGCAASSAAAVPAGVALLVVGMLRRRRRK